MKRKIHGHRPELNLGRVPPTVHLVIAVETAIEISSHCDKAVNRQTRNGPSAQRPYVPACMYHCVAYQASLPPVLTQLPSQDICSVRTTDYGNGPEHLHCVLPPQTVCIYSTGFDVTSRCSCREVLSLNLGTMTKVS